MAELPPKPEFPKADIPNINGRDWFAMSMIGLLILGEILMMILVIHNLNFHSCTPLQK